MLTLMLADEYEIEMTVNQSAHLQLVARQLWPTSYPSNLVTPYTFVSY